MRIRPPKLSTRLLFLVLAASLPGMVLALVLAFNQRRSAIEGVQSRAYELASLVAGAHESKLAAMRLLLAGLESATAELLADPEACRRHLRALLPLDRTVANLGLVTLDGAVLCSALPVPDGTTPAAARWLDEVAAARRFSVSEPVMDAIANRAVVVVAAPHIVNGELLHVLFGSLNLSSFAETDSTAPLPTGTVVMLIDSAGTVLSRRPDPGRWVGGNVRYGPLARAALARPHGTTSVRGPDGAERFYAFLPMPGRATTHTHLIVGIPRSTALSQANDALRRSILVLLAVLLVALLLARLTADRLIMKPMEALVSAAERLRAGDLSARTGITMHHEGNRLAAAFDAMADRVQLQTAELERSREQLRLLARRTEEEVERERRRIARTVHDDLGQALTALKLDATWLAQRINGDDPAIGEHLQSMHRLLETTSATVRRIATELRPSVLDDLGLDAALEWQTHEFSRRTGIPSEVRLHIDRASLPPAVAIALFRILQEALTNVARHASATRVAVTLHELPDRAILEVTDDGVGIPAQPPNAPPSLGLLGMGERAQALGGTVALEPAEPRGTRVCAIIPLDDTGPNDRP